jgi:hypothetical protein
MCHTTLPTIACKDDFLSKFLKLKLESPDEVAISERYEQNLSSPLAR